ILHLVYANPAASRMAKIELSSATGKTMGELFPAAIARGRPTAYTEVVASGREMLLERAVYAECGDDVVAGRMVPLPNQCVAILFESVTGKRAGETPGAQAFLDS